MMENRSFDQMLGYLALKGGLDDVNGLTGDEVNYDAEGNPHQIFEWGPDEGSFRPPQDESGKVLDPCHGPQCVAEQLAEHHGQTPGGFVRNFVATRKDRRDNPVEVPREYWRLPMGYYSEEHLPAYDLLARAYCTCDAWHASIPGDTWPNRLYALAGRQVPSLFAKPGFLHNLIKRLRFIPRIGKLTATPVFEAEAFTRQLRCPNGAGTRTTRPRCAEQTRSTGTSVISIARTSRTSTAGRSASRPRSWRPRWSSCTTASWTTPPKASCAT
jgi:hypothetical protein